VDRSAIVRGIDRHLAAATRPAPLRPLEQLATAAALTPETRVRLRPALRVTLRTEGTELVLVLPDRIVRFPASAAEAVRAATSGAVVTAGTLPIADHAEAAALLAQLLRDGVVVPA
jgi:hypothetical protein